ncbi:hypothetical protein LWC34_45580 [Kibdelosporangium philippinense]|uniref:CD-NTase associated protein 4-like DNA endonuclease domain-containing protein n=1 Tax=Kibdelosporangium philippinense TaxID=211113 RepID=A0ABS8ZW04_9PSEU|nr:hypothetical protein [Kibdelosporangium philippinense]MCE7010032.1 hypothetical protein [Kibdelosporangium philippinense]
MDGDKSLFAWVVENYKDGHLICDDQSGETADFLHISASSRTLSFIHVKKSGSSSEQRKISASAHEVVIGQAVKNLIWMDFTALRTRLESPPIEEPACWNSGVKGSDRSAFLAAFDRRDATSRTEIIIVQPHVREAHYKHLHENGLDHEQISEDTLRLHLLEGLLNAARSTTTSVGADLFIIGSSD